MLWVEVSPSKIYAQVLATSKGDPVWPEGLCRCKVRIKPYWMKLDPNPATGVLIIVVVI